MSVIGKDLPPGFPRITRQPQNIHTARLKIDFHCLVIGKGPLSIIWYHNRRPVPIDSWHKQYSMSSGGGEDMLFSSNLALTNVSLADKGFYQCVAINEIGQIVSNQAHIRFNYAHIKKQKRARRVSYCITSFIPLKALCIFTLLVKDF